MPQAGLEHVVLLSAALFAIGLAGLVLRRSLLVALVSLQLVLAAGQLAFVAFERIRAAGADEAARVAPDGQAFALVVAVVGAAQIAVGLAVVMCWVRNRDSIDVDDASTMRW